MECPSVDFFKHDPMSHSESTIRLLRLIQGEHDDDIACEIFQLQINEPGAFMPYEALSYTWDEGQPNHMISANGCSFAVRANLYDALEHLRLESQDRILWIDAICIDQSNTDERGHQVQLMSEIFGNAEHVLFWLGSSRWEIDCFMDLMLLLQRKGYENGCTNYHPTDSRWKSIWADIWGEHRRLKSMSTISRGFLLLLQRPWWKRVWIVQEVARAKSATVLCGNNSISARTLAVAPSILGVEIDSHSQAIMDIFPGPSRRGSWWTTERNLYNLLLKFRHCESSDKRDRIYALLGMSSDASDGAHLRAEYAKTEEEIVQDTVSFLLGLDALSKISRTELVQWRIQELLDNVEKLESALFGSAVETGKQQLVRSLLHCSRINVNSTEFLGKTPLILAITTKQDQIVQVLADSCKIDVNLTCPGDILGQTPLLSAIKARYDFATQLLISRRDTLINVYNKRGENPLVYATEHGLNTVVRALLKRDDIEVNHHSFDASGEKKTLFQVAIEKEYNDIVEMFIKRDDVNTASSGDAILTNAIHKGNEKLAKTLIVHKTFRIMGHSKDGENPLFLAAKYGQNEIVALLLQKKEVQANSRDAAGKTPLSYAAENGHSNVVATLLKRHDVEFQVGKPHLGHNPLTSAFKFGRYEVLKQLLEWKGINPASHKAEELFTHLMQRTSKTSFRDRDLYALLALAYLTSMYRNRRELKCAEQLQVKLSERTLKMIDRLVDANQLVDTYSLRSAYASHNLQRELIQLDIQAKERVLEILSRAVSIYRLIDILRVEWVYRDAESWKEAEVEKKVRKRGLKMLSGFTSTHHFRAVVNLLLICKYQERYEAAGELEVRIKAWTQEMLSEARHPHQLTKMGFLLSIYREKGLVEEANELEARVEKRKELGFEDLKRASVLSDLPSTHRI